MKKSTVSSEQVAYGSNPEQPKELAKTLTSVVTASLLTGGHTLVVGEPGYGKTEIPEAMLWQVYGAGAVKTFPCGPTTLASDMFGYANPLYAMEADAESKGLQQWITLGTPVDPRYKAVVMDEFTRMSDAGLDAFIMVGHRSGEHTLPPTVATANWLTPSIRTEAAFDRFWFTVLYQPSIVDVNALINTPDIYSWKYDLPTAEEVEGVRAMYKEYLKSPSLYRATATIIESLEALNRATFDDVAFKLNNRRVFQLRAIMYTLGALAAGTSDFTDLPASVWKALKWAYPMKNFSQMTGWHSIVSSIISVRATQLAHFKGQSFTSFQQVYAKYANRSGNVPEESRPEMLRELGTAWAALESEFTREFGTDDEAMEIKREMFTMYRQIVLGNNPLSKV